MHPVLVLVHLAAAVLLLLWAVRMVRTGVERAWGGPLRRVLKRAGGSRVAMAGAGAALAVMLQSSTAVALLVSGFLASGLVTAAPGLAALLGADLGSALVVKVLSFDLSALIPFLVVAGVLLFLKSEGRQARQLGRVVLGVAFILLALGMVGDATEPMRRAGALPAAMAYLARDPVTAFLAAAGFVWALHSSVAALLLFVTLAGAGVLPEAAFVPLVAGANVGAGLVALWLTRGQPPEVRRLPLANLIFRAAFALGLLGLSEAVALPLERLGAGPAARLVNLHIAFNAALLLLALPFVSWMTGAAARLLPGRAPEEGLPRLETLLDRTVIAAPGLALASATRELLRMGETVDTMFRPLADILDGGNPAQIARVRQLDQEVNWRHSEIKLFVAEVNRGRLSRDEARRGIDLTDFAINLEHIGDIITKTILPLAVEKAERGLAFSPDGWAEICRLHAQVQANLQLALNVLVSGDVDSARRLVREKEAVRRLERDSHDRHLRRLEAGRIESIETSDMHLEVVRAMKEINSLLSMVAYPILTETGELLQSRLARPARALGDGPPG